MLYGFLSVDMLKNLLLDFENDNRFKARQWQLPKHKTKSCQIVIDFLAKVVRYLRWLPNFFNLASRTVMSHNKQMKSS